MSNGVSDGNDMNDLGAVVGTSTFGGYRNHGALVGEDLTHGFLYQDGSLVDLNSLINVFLGITIDQAFQINNSGQILVSYYSNSTPLHDQLGLLDLVPGSAAVPEPASWALMINGFGLVGGALRSSRRKVAFAA